MLCVGTRKNRLISNQRKIICFAIVGYKAHQGTYTFNIPFGFRENLKAATQGFIIIYLALS